MIKIRDLHKKFDQNEVLKGISLDFSKPEITAILGPNGSGKTTLLKSVLGMVIPSSGTIEFEEKNIRGNHIYRAKIDYLPQIARFPDNLRVTELLDLIAEIRGDQTRKEQLIKLFELEPHLSKKLGTLSGGTRQKVNILQSLGYENPVIILDEPTAGLDPLSMVRLKEFILQEKAKSRIILFTTHIMGLVDALADRIIYLLDGNIYFDGSTDELKAKYNTDDVEHAIAEILKRRISPFSSNGYHKEISTQTLISAEL